MNKCIIKPICLLLLTFLTVTTFQFPAFAEATGKLNVFTDVQETEIYVDGQLAGKESLVGYTLSVGTHYVKVAYQGKTSYSKTVDIYEGRTTTITSDNFVDIKTKTPSRGAVDVEAERLREYRGNGAFGVFGSSPSSGLSVKWWFAKNMGIQGIGFTETHSTYSDTAFSGRLLIGFPQKIFAEEVLDAYMALGYGRYWHTDQIAPSLSTLDETTSIAFGLEAKLGQLANAIFQNQRLYISDMDGVFIFIGELATLGLLNLCYTSIEIGMETKHKYGNLSHDVESNMKVNFGLHYYF